MLAPCASSPVLTDMSASTIGIDAELQSAETMDLDDDTIITATHRVGRKIPDMVVGDLTEREILAMAPAMVCDRIHWSTAEPMDLTALMSDLPLTARTRAWSDGQSRIWVDEGMGQQARELIREWCERHGVEVMNMRVEASVPFRDVDSIPHGLFGELLLATTDWLYPRTYAIRRKLVADLELIDDDDTRSMMYLFISDHADRFDADRVGRNGTLNFASFMLGKLRKWPQDAARAAWGRTLIDDHMHLNQAIDESMATLHRRPTEPELAARMKTSVSDLRKREFAIAEVSGMRNYDSIISGSMGEDSEGVDAPDSVDVSAEGTSFQVDAMLTKAIIDSIMAPTSTRGTSPADPMALATVYLSFWGEMSRQELATELGVLPKTAAASVQRVISQVGAAGIL
ncbi:MAG: hypothetical protein RL205_141 [Actinomycetota bacterium]